MDDLDDLRAEVQGELRELKELVAGALRAAETAVTEARDLASRPPPAPPRDGDGGGGAALALMQTMMVEQSKTLTAVLARPAPDPMDTLKTMMELQKLMGPSIGEQALVAALEQLTPLLPDIARHLTRRLRGDGSDTAVTAAQVVAAVQAAVQDAAQKGQIQRANGNAGDHG